VIDGETAIEKAVEIARKAGWFYVWVTSVRSENGKWILSIEGIIRRAVIILDSEGRLVEFREEPFIKAV